MHRSAPDAGIAAAITGAGRPVVLVHGALGDQRQWAPIAAALAARFRVHALSRRHHWPRATADTPYSYEGHRDDLLEYVRAVGDAVHLVGHSWGAGVALLAALREPERIRTLTLVEPAFHSLLPASAPGRDEEVAGRGEMLATVKALVAAGDDAAAVRALFDWIQDGSGGFAALPLPVQQALLENAPTLGPTFAHPAPQVTCADLRPLTVRTLVVNGEHTRLYYRLIGEAVVACLPHATPARLANAGHMTIVERPAETAALLLAFLSSA